MRKGRVCCRTEGVVAGQRGSTARSRCSARSFLARTGAVMTGRELRVGLRISARYQTNKIGFDTAWYTGSVLAVNSDGSCDIA